jgi:hypothetical protein
LCTSQSNAASQPASSAPTPATNSAASASSASVTRQSYASASHHVSYLNMVTRVSMAHRQPKDPPIIDYTEGEVLIDSGATDSMVGRRSQVSDPQPFYATVVMADSGVIAVTQAGTMRVRVHCLRQHKNFTIPFLDTMIVPNLRIPLIAVIPFAISGHQISFTPNHVEITLNIDSINELILWVMHPFYNQSRQCTYNVIRHCSHPNANAIQSSPRELVTEEPSQSRVITTANSPSLRTTTLE